MITRIVGGISGISGAMAEIDGAGVLKKINYLIFHSWAVKKKLELQEAAMSGPECTERTYFVL